VASLIYLRTDTIADPVATWDDIEAGIAAVEEKINAADAAFVYTPFVADTRTATWVLTKAEIQGLEDRLHTIAEYLEIPHLLTTWSGLMPINYNAMNHIIFALMPQAYIDAGQDVDGDLGDIMPEDYDPNISDIDWLSMYNGDLSYDKLDALLIPPEFLYVAGFTTQKVFKIDPADFTKLSESADYGGTIYALASDGTYIYAAGSTTQKIYKYDPTDMSKVAESADYGGKINKLVVLGSYIYAAGDTVQKIFKYALSNLSKVGESAAYGDDIDALCTDGTYIYAGGWCYVIDSTDNFRVKKYSAATLADITKSAELISGIAALASDGTYVYATAGTIVYKLSPADMSTADYLEEIETGVYGLAVSDGYLYAGANSQYQLRKIDVSDMTVADYYPLDTHRIYALAVDDNYIYLSGSSIVDEEVGIIRVSKSTMEKGTGYCAYGGRPRAIIIA
jgi:hypothetical protein